MTSTLWQTWLRTVDAAPDAPALLDGHTGETLTRGALTARAGQWAGAPVRAEIVAGKTVAFAATNGFRWFEVFLALQSTGAAALPLDAALPTGRRAEAAARLGAHFLLHADDRRLEPLPAPSTGPAPDTCLFKLTSGTTGEARALACTAANMLADGRQICATMRIRPDDRNLGVVPFGHSYGLGNLVLPLILQGTAVVASTEMLPGALAETVARFGVTVLPTVPAILRALAEADVPPARLGGLRRVISAGAFLRPETARAFAERFGRRVHNFYGSSETGGICFDADGEATLSGRAVGRPLTGVRVGLDAGAGGRVRVSSAAVVAPGTHRLADRGEWNAHGELRLLGRAVGGVANIGGKKVDPAEIERLLGALPGVSDAWVSVRSRAGGGEDFLLAAVETVLAPEAVRAALAAQVPAWQMPRRLLTLPELPRNARGKLDRARLEAMTALRAE